MTEYLIINIRTLAETWIEAETPTAALIDHENRSRRVKLPSNSKASHDSRGDILDVSLGDSVIRGLRQNVTR